jgi:hypothetical protein
VDGGDAGNGQRVALRPIALRGPLDEPRQGDPAVADADVDVGARTAVSALSTSSTAASVSASARRDASRSPRRRRSVTLVTPVTRRVVCTASSRWTAEPTVPRRITSPAKACTEISSG